MEPVQYLKVLRRRWWIVVLAVAVAGATAWVTTAVVATPAATTSGAEYQATAVLWNPSLSPLGQGSPITDTQTLAQVATLPDVASIAARTLHFHGSPLALSGQVQASADQTSGFLRITATASAPARAENVSSAFAGALIQYLGQLKNAQVDQGRRLLQEQISALQKQGADPAVIGSLQASLSQLAIRRATPVSLSVIQAPKAERVPTHGFQPPKSRLARTLIGLIVGLLAGLALALVAERFDTKIRTRQAAEEHFRLPVLAEVPAIRRRRRKRVVTVSHPISRAADAFRLLSVGIARFGSNGGSPNGDGSPGGNGKPAVQGSSTTVLVTSPGARDGKTTVVANLGAAFAEVGARVLVVSCDLRRPAVHRVFGVADRPGLTEVLISANGDGDAELANLDLGHYVEFTAVPRVALLPSGGASDRPGELLGSKRMRRLLRRVEESADVVVLDCPPLLVASDVAPLLPQVDAVLLVVRAGKTSAELAGRTANLLERLGAPVAGLILNDAPRSSLPLPRRRAYRPSRSRRRDARRTARERAESNEREPNAAAGMWSGS